MHHLLSMFAHERICCGHKEGASLVRNSDLIRELLPEGCPASTELGREAESKLSRPLQALAAIDAARWTARCFNLRVVKAERSWFKLIGAG